MDTIVLMLLPLFPFVAIYFLAQKVFGARLVHLLIRVFLRVLKGFPLNLSEYIQAEENGGHKGGKGGHGKPRRGLRYFPLRRSIVVYLVVLAMYLPFKFVLFSHDPTPWVAFLVVHLVAGLVLSHAVLKHVVWHDVYNTLSGVSKAKLFALMGWPLTYPILFLQFMAVRYL